MATVRAVERFAVLGTIDPDAYAANPYNTDVIDMQNWGSVVFIVQAGDLGSSATLDFLVKGDSASGGSFTTTVTGKSITQLTQAGSDSDKQVIVEVTAEEAKAQGFRYLRGTMTIAVATSDAGVTVLGFSPRFSPAHKYDLASVDEIIT